MIVFSLVCTLLIGLALASILPPLRHPDRIHPATTQAHANVAVYRRQFAEMESDLRDRILTPGQFLHDREELEQRLIADLPEDSGTGNKDRPTVGSDMLVCVLAVGLPITAILLYLVLGTPASLAQMP